MKKSIDREEGMFGRTYRFGRRGGENLRLMRYGDAGCGYGRGVVGLVFFLFFFFSYAYAVGPWTGVIADLSQAEVVGLGLVSGVDERCG